MTIKKNRQARFTHSIEGTVKTEEKGDTMVVTGTPSAKGSSKRTKESLGVRIERFERKARRR